MPGGRATGPNGCCCRFCGNLPIPVLASQFEGSVLSVYKSNSDRTFTNIENDSPSPVLVNDPQFSQRVEWRQDDRFLLCANPSHDGTLVKPASNFTLYARDTTCTKILVPLPGPNEPGSSGVNYKSFVDWSGNLFGFSGGSSGYMFANDCEVAQGGRNPTSVNSPSGWTNPGAVKGAVGTAETHGGGGNLIGTVFGFSIPTIPSSYKIFEISFLYDRHADTVNDTKEVTVQLTKDGSTGVGSNYANLFDPNLDGGWWTETQQTAQYPAGTDDPLWGTTWTPAEVNASTFGVIFNSTSTTGNGFVSNFRIIISYTVDGSQVYTVSSSAAPNRIAVLPHSTGTIMCFSGDDFTISPPGYPSAGGTGFGVSVTTYAGDFVQMFDGASFTVGTIDTITLPSSNPYGWICQSARFAQDQIHCGFVICTASGIGPVAPFYFYSATRSGSNLASPTLLTFTADTGGRTAIGDIWAISPDGSQIAFRANSGGSPDYVHVYSSGSLVASFKASGTDNSESIYQLAFSDDGKQLAAAQYGIDGLNHQHGRVCVWDTTFTESSQPTGAARMGTAFAHAYRVP